MLKQAFNIPHVYYSRVEDTILGILKLSWSFNLGVPKVHAELCLAALKAGKHVYVERKTFGTN